MKSIHATTDLLCKSLLVLSIAASAQAMEDSASRLIEEVVVTAEHRESTLQETRISISAFDAETIRELGISNALDLGHFVPNVNVQPYVGGKTGVSYNIRGVGNAETLISFDPAVSVYLDGVLISKNVGALLDVVDLQRVEVLRGPQGTLYGQNTMGGAINYITQNPASEFEARLEATAGNYDQRDLRGMVNVPLLGADSGAGELNVRVTAATLNRDGIQDNDFDGGAEDEMGTVDRNVYMGQLEWVPTERFSARYTYDRTRIDEIPEAAYITNANLATFYGTVLAPFEVDEDERPDGIAIDNVQIAETEVDGHALNVEWGLTDTLTFYSLTGYRELFNYGEADSDGSPISAITPIPAAINTRDLNESEFFSQEFRLLGTVGAIDYTTGFYYMEEEGEVYNETIAVGNPSENVADYRNEAWAVYGQGTFSATERVDVTAGVRYTQEDREMGKAFVAGVSFVPPITLDELRTMPQFAGNIFPDASKDFDNVSWLLSVGYHWNDDVMTYAKVSTGYQSGGFNSRDQVPADFVRGFDEETLVSYEVGLKSRWSDRFLVNGAAFFSDYDDKRVNQFNPETLTSVQRNAGVVEIWGVELEVLAYLTDYLSAGFNYGHVNHDYVEYDQINPDGSITDLSDSTNFPFSPENTASAHVAYEYPLNVGLLRGRVDWSYRDEMTFLAPQPERNSADSLHLLNARISLNEIKGPGDSLMRVSLWGKNLTDEGYWTFGVNIFDTFGFDINTYGEPRTYGLDFEISF